MAEPASLPDGPLIAAALAGDEAAFAQLARRYQAPLFHAARSRLGDRQLAEDAVQEALLCAFRWLHTYDSRYSFRTWLWTILLNQCTRIGQRRNKLATRVAPLPELSTASSPVELLLAQENADRLHALLARLPEPQADALRLRFFGELKFEEIAQAMECSVSGAKNRVRLGLTQLAAWLNPHAGEAQVAHPAEKVAGDSR